MPRHYMRCVACRKIGVTADLLGHCSNAGLVSAKISEADAQRRDLNALKQKYRSQPERRATKVERLVGWLRSWLPE